MSIFRPLGRALIALLVAVTLFPGPATAQTTALALVSSDTVPPLTPTRVSWTGEVTPSSGLWSLARPSEILVPPGCSWLELSYSLEFTSPGLSPAQRIPEEFRTFVTVNGPGGSTFGAPSTWGQTLMPYTASSAQGLIPVGEDDIVELWVLHNLAEPVAFRPGTGSFMHGRCVLL